MNDPNRTRPCQPTTVDEAAAEQPRHIGRYRVERILGQGGFGGKTGWLCPALLRYFEQAPGKLYVQVKAAG